MANLAPWFGYDSGDHDLLFLLFVGYLDHAEGFFEVWCSLLGVHIGMQFLLNGTWKCVTKIWKGEGEVEEIAEECSCILLLNAWSTILYYIYRSWHWLLWKCRYIYIYIMEIYITCWTFDIPMIMIHKAWWLGV